ncbi:hypothetical protein BH11ARM2_BH11ARM2_34300 [soil metagenome]
MLGYLQGGDQPSMRHQAAGSGAWEFVVELFQAGANDLKGANLLGFLAKKIGGGAFERFKKSAVGEWILSKAGNEDFHRLKAMDPSDIAEGLYDRLGEELGAGLPERGGRACRAILFLDTFEMLKVGVETDAQQYRAEEWVRRIYQSLPSVLVVLAGRDRVVWGEVERDWDHPRYVQQHLVGGLSEHDAREFLGRCGVGEPLLQEAILGACLDVSVQGDQAYHAYSLALATDAVQEERKVRVPDPASFRLRPGDHDELAQRFLKSLGRREMEPWVIRLSLTPAFDEAAAKEVYEGEAKSLAWDDLLDFSFVFETEPGSGWWTLHARMAESLRHFAARKPERCREWHEAWRAARKARSEEPDDRFAFQAWTHAWRLDPQPAQVEWDRTVEEFRRRALTLRHYAMLDWWAPILAEPLEERQRALIGNSIAVELVEAKVGDRKRNLDRAIDLYRAALRVCTEEAAPLDWAMTQNNLGAALAALPTGDRGANLAAAVAAYRAALRVYTEEAAPLNWAMTQFNLARGLLQPPLEDRGGAFEAFHATLRVWTEESAPLHWARSLFQMAILFEGSGQRAECLECLRGAERGYRAVGMTERAQRLLEEIARLEAVRDEP